MAKRCVRCLRDVYYCDCAYENHDMDETCEGIGVLGCHDCGHEEECPGCEDCEGEYDDIF